MHTTYRLGLVAGLTLATLAPMSRAQTASPAPAADSADTTTAPATPTPAQTTGGSSDTVKMSAFQVSDVPIEQQILPTSRPFASVFGTDDNILDVPRNVTIISRAQMDVIDMQDTTEFSKLTSSSYTDSNFGSPSNPSIRGQSADLFLNGMRQRIGESGDGMPVDFNIVESVNIVPGPATAVQGASAYVGGFADLISKQPFFDATKGSISYTVGSYDTNRWTLDLGGPINPNLAYRFSYSGEDSDGFWINWIKQTTSVYGAVTWRPTKDYEVFALAKAFWADYRENFGINRVTQALVSNGLYIPGTNINNDTSATAADPQNAANVASNNTIAWGTPVPVDYHETAQGPASHAHGMEYNSQVIQTLHLGPDVKIVNNTMYSYTKRDTFNSDGYSEIIDPSWFIDNRTEFIVSKPKLSLNAGIEEKYQSTWAVDDFFFEPVNVWDLSSPSLRTTLNSYLSPGAGPNFVSQPVPGFEDRFGTPGFVNGDSNKSDAEVYSAFVQDTYKLTEQYSLVSGVRFDLLHVQSRDPYLEAQGQAIEIGEPNANISFIDKLTPTTSTYLTYNYSENYTGALADGGGFSPTISNNQYTEASQLIELGAKFQLDDNKVFLSNDIFHQTREQKPQGSPAVQYEYYGYEVSLNYQPNKQFFATVGYSWINGSLPAGTQFQGYSTNQIPGGPPDPFTNPLQTTGRWRAAGQPLDTFNALASYTWTNGFGVESNILVTSKMNNDYQGYVVIPVQYSLDAEIFYKTKHWEYKLSGTNVTNRHNWEPSVDTYALEGIVPEPGAEIYGTVKYKF